MEIIDFQLTGDYIQLIQLLKACNVVENGAEAQNVVSQGLVKRNGETELRKRAKITRGENIVFQQYSIKII